MPEQHDQDAPSAPPAGRSGPKWRAEPKHPTWNRYRGQARRGTRTTAGLTDQDLAAAISELEGAREQLAAVTADLTSDARERAAMVRALVSKIRLAAAFLDEVVDRYGGVARYGG